MSNPERFWESAIAEAASGRQPPDQSAEILARLNAPPVRGWIATRRWPVRVAIHTGQTALAAGVLLAIGLATGVVQWPWGNPPEIPTFTRELIAAPGTKWLDHADYVALDEGALLLATDSPEVRCGESKFAGLDGLALVRAGTEPTPDEQAELNTWMETKGVENAMLKNATRWITGTALCVLMLQGTATLDGQKVEAEKPAEPVWHKISSAMELDRLPPEAMYVEASGLDGEYLGFIAEVPRIRGIRFLGAPQLTTVDLLPLAEMPDLRVLDLRGSTWAQEQDYSPLLKLPKLESVGIDLYASAREKDEAVEAWQKRTRSSVTAQIDTLKQFTARKVRVEFGMSTHALPCLDLAQQAFPDTTDLDLPSAWDDTCRLIGRFSKLKRLVIRSMAAGELGYMQLARLPALETLDLSLYTHSASPKPEFFHHLAKIKTLRTLRIPAWRWTGSFTPLPKGVITEIGRMEQLRELELPEPFWPQIARLDGQETNPFKSLTRLESFSIRIPDHPYADEHSPQQREPSLDSLDLGHIIGARTIDIHTSPNRMGALWSEIKFEKLQAATEPKLSERVETFRVRITASGNFSAVPPARMATCLKRYPNLKRVEVSGSTMYGTPPDVVKLVSDLRAEFADKPSIEVVQVEDK